MRTGVRVVRGPQWKWGDQDGGEGYVGTVVELPATAPNTCLVQWDCRPTMNYRAGLSNRYDLRVFDSAPSGIKHEYPCAGCNDKVICGMLWECVECPNVRLCTFCYMNDKHSTGHSFRRLNDNHSMAIVVQPRRLSQKLDSYGVFQSAIVKRGRDWTWDNQDGEGTGTVTMLQGWSEESSRSVVCVQWQNGATNVYRMGHRGKTDLMAIRPAKGWSYYVEHLPSFGEEISEGRLPIFTIGESVRVDSNMTRVKKLSDGHGQWHENMKNYIGLCGIVHRITESDDVRIMFSDRVKWTYNPKAITKIFNVNDKVMLTSDLETLREYHGDALNIFTRLRSISGVISEIRPETCLHQVHFMNGVSQYVHANCLYAVDTANRNVNSLVDEQQQQQLLHMAALSAAGPASAAQPQPLQQQGGATLVGSAAVFERPLPTLKNVAEFFEALQQGNVEKAHEMLRSFNDLANSEFNGQKALFASILSGRPEILRLISQFGIDVTVRGPNNDTIIHAVIRKQQFPLLQIFSEVLWHPIINASNDDLDTILHLGVKVGVVEAVRFMLFNFNTLQSSIKDSEGNAPLHLAILSGKDDIVVVMLDNRRMDPEFQNEDGHNALHLACIKGKTRIMEKILRIRPDLVNVSNKKGFAPIHLAVFHNQAEALQLMLTQKFIHVNARIIRNREFNSYTSLHIAVIKMHTKCIQILIEIGKVEVSLTEDGNTSSPLHLAVEALIRTGCRLTHEEVYNLLQIEPSSFSLDKFVEMCPGCVPLAVCCYLSTRGAKLNIRNKLQKTPLNLLADSADCKRLLPTLKTFSSTDTNEDGLGAGPSGTNNNANGNRADSVAPGTATATRGVVNRDRVTAAGAASSSSRQQQQPPSLTTAASTAVRRPAVPPNFSANLNDFTQSTTNTPASNAQNVVGRAAGGANVAVGSSSPACSTDSGTALPPGQRINLTLGDVCRMCQEVPSNVLFEPCNHIVCCLRCVYKNLLPNPGSVTTPKSCIACLTPIQTLIGPEGEVVPRSDVATVEVLCPVCMENPKNMASKCGHVLCRNCARVVNECPICRAPMTDLRPVYY